LLAPLPLLLWLLLLLLLLLALLIGPNAAQKASFAIMDLC
jgi:hypothetical protein